MPTTRKARGKKDNAIEISNFFPPTLRAAGGKRRVVCTRARENWKEVGRLVSLLAFSRTPTASVHLTTAERGSCCKFRYPLDPLPHIFWTLERRPWSSGTLLCVISWFHFPSSSPRGGKQHPELRRGGGGRSPLNFSFSLFPPDGNLSSGGGRNRK